jgi:hypothetical protein
MELTGQQIFEIFQAGDITPLQFAEELIDALKKELIEEVDELDDAKKEMLKYWEGDSADAAGRGVDPLIQAHRESAPLVDRASKSVGYQKDVYTWGKNSVQPVPPEPEEPGPFARGVAAIVPGVPDPDVPYRKALAAHNAANENNVRVMAQYANATVDNSNVLPEDFGIVEDDGAPLYIGRTETSSSGGSATISTPTLGQPGYTGSMPGPGIGSVGSGPNLSGGGGPIGGPAPSPVPHPATPGPTTGIAAPVTGPGGGGPGGGGTPGPRPGGPVVAPVGPAGGGQSNDSRRPPRPGARPPAGSSRAGARMTTGGLGRTAGGASGGAPGAGRTPTILRGGAAATARLTGGTAGLQAGKGAGVLGGGGPGSGAGGAAAARAAASGVGARPGMGGVAGAAGQRGKGAEDSEHKDKYAVKEEFDEGLKVEYDELGAKAIDETTGHTVVNPVIGAAPEAPSSQQVKPHTQYKDKDA